MLSQPSCHDTPKVALELHPSESVGMQGRRASWPTTLQGKSLRARGAKEPKSRRHGGSRIRPFEFESKTWSASFPDNAHSAIIDQEGRKAGCADEYKN